MFFDKKEKKKKRIESLKRRKMPMTMIENLRELLRGTPAIF